MKFLQAILLILFASYAWAAKKTSTGAGTPAGFIQLQGFKALDIGCGSEGDVCAVGTDHLLYCYDFNNDKWDQIPLPEEITNVTAVDVDDDGKIYIVAECGIFFLDCNDKWVRLPGSGRDIGVGANFDVYKIGNDLGSSGDNDYIRYIGNSTGSNETGGNTTNGNSHYGVWKLFCECDCNCICTRQCLRFRRFTFNVCEVLKKKCYWFRAGVFGVAVDVFPNGDAAVVDKAGHIYIVNGLTFDVVQIADLPNNLNAIDVTVGNNGVLYVNASNGKIYSYNFGNNTYTLVTSVPSYNINSQRICASAYDLLWFVDNTSRVTTSARFGYIG